MPVIFNLRHLEEKNLLLKGELPVAELDLATVDELIHLSELRVISTFGCGFFGMRGCILWTY